MNHEEAFEKWFSNTLLTPDFKPFYLLVWLEATRQAYEDSAELVEQRGVSGGIYHAVDPKRTAEAIRAMSSKD